MTAATQTYEFKVDGHLDAHWATWLHTDRLHHGHSGSTRFRTRPIDQAQLHGVLNQLRDLGVVVRRMAAVETPSGAGPALDARPR